MKSLHVKYLLVGAGVASSAAAMAIRQRDPDGAVLLVGKEVNRPYHRPALSRDYLLGRTNRDRIFTVGDDWFVENKVELRTGRRASTLDTARRSVALDDGEVVQYDRLLIATGSAPSTLAVLGAELPNVYYLRTLDDAERLHNAMAKALHEGRAHDRGRGRVVVVGGGLLGMELAATLHEAGLAVEIVMASAHAWPRFAGESIGRLALKHLENKGVRVRTATTVLKLEGDGRVQRVVLSDGTIADCDFVVGALGISASKELLRNTPIAAEKAILVDDHARTSDEHVWAAGDCAAIFDARFGKYRHLDHWDSAQATGTLAGTNMAGGDERYDLVNRYTSRVFDL